jgi:hypothetical protein
VVGNDIVDLALGRKSNWKRPGYLNKIFTTKEQLLISSAESEYHGTIMESEGPIKFIIDNGEWDTFFL